MDDFHHYFVNIACAIVEEKENKDYQIRLSYSCLHTLSVCSNKQLDLQFLINSFDPSYHCCPSYRDVHVVKEIPLHYFNRIISFYYDLNFLHSGSPSFNLLDSMILTFFVISF